MPDGGGVVILVAAEGAATFRKDRLTCSASARVSRRRWSTSHVIAAEGGGPGASDDVLEPLGSRFRGNAE